MRDFIAIDFETANGQPSSVCSVGAVMVRNGRVADSFYSLIQPEPNYYSYFCQRVHGLSQRDTDKAPVFPVVWHQLEDCIADVFFSDQLAFFDRTGYRFRDTLQAARQHFGRVLPNHQLHTVAAACGYDLQRHHHALADAEACAAIALKLLASSSNKISKR